MGRGYASPPKAHDHSHGFEVTARRLADFIASAEAEESLLIQRLQDAAARNVRPGKDNSVSKQDGVPPSDGDSLPQAEAPAFQPAMAAVSFISPPQLYEEY
jgi:hypothetical protein